MADANDDLADITVGDATALATMLREWRAFKAGGETAPGNPLGLPDHGYLKLKSKVGTTGPRTYTADLYASVYGGTPLATDVSAWNDWEVNNDATHGSEYTFSGDIVGALDVPMGKRHRVIEFTYNSTADKWGYVFSCRQDPDINCAT